MKRLVDYLGIIYLVLGLGLLLVMLDRGQRADWFNFFHGFAISLSAQFASIAVMVWHELRFPSI